MNPEKQEHIHIYFSQHSAAKSTQLFVKTRPGVSDDAQTSRIRELLKAEPENYELLMKLGDSLRFQLRYTEAIEAYTDAIISNPQRFEAYEGRGTSYMKSMRFKEALADHLTYISHIPPQLYPLYRVGLCYYYNNLYEKALTYFEQAEKFALEEDFGEMIVATCFWKAMCLLKMGRLDDARDVARGFEPKTQVGHHTSYRRAVFVLSGRYSLSEELAALEGEPDSLEYSTAMYGLLVYMKEAGYDSETLKKYRSKMLERDRFWACFGYIAALNDRFNKYLP